jgi:hypothetical protein
MELRGCVSLELSLEQAAKSRCVLQYWSRDV